MCIIVTGGSGLIGSNLTGRLLQEASVRVDEWMAGDQRFYVSDIHRAAFS